jgi:hypothetical protein
MNKIFRVLAFQLPWILGLPLSAQSPVSSRPKLLSVDSNRIATELGAALTKASRIELALADGSIFSGRVQMVTDENIAIDVSEGPMPRGLRSIRTGELSVIRIQNARASKRKRVLGAVLGGLGGLMLGGPLAFNIGADGHEAAGVTVFFAMPIAGAWAGTKIAGRSRGWTTVLVKRANR